MDTEKLKPFNEFNSEKSAMVNEICYRLFKESNNDSNEPNNNFFKELKKIQIPTIAANTKIEVTIGTGAEYGNAGFVPILFETGTNGQTFSFGKYTDSSGNVKLAIKNNSPIPVVSEGVLYLLVTEVL